MTWDEIEKEKVAAPIMQESVKAKKEVLGEIEQWLFNSTDTTQDFVGLVYGGDGTGKSGFILDYPLAENDVMVVLDLDGGDMPIANTFHKEKYKGKKIIVKDPTTVDTETFAIDYDETFNKIVGTIEWVKLHHKEAGIKVFVLDGISTLLKYCEYKMREILKKSVGDGIDRRYWQLRNAKFIEIITLVKSLPLNVFFIAHDDFIATDDKDLGSVRQRMNQMAFQKLRFVREENTLGVAYYLIIDKSKYKPSIDGQRFQLLRINKADGKLDWKAQDAWQRLMT